MNIDSKLCYELIFPGSLHFCIPENIFMLRTGKDSVSSCSYGLNPEGWYSCSMCRIWIHSSVLSVSEVRVCLGSSFYRCHHSFLCFWQRLLGDLWVLSQLGASKALYLSVLWPTRMHSYAVASLYTFCIPLNESVWDKSGQKNLNVCYLFVRDSAEQVQSCCLKNWFWIEETHP